MNINTTARHCELEPEDRIFVHQRLERLLRYFRNPQDLMEAHVVVAAEKYRHSAEITLKLRRAELVSREQADDPRAAIELAAERLEHQIRRLKERRVDRKRGGRAREVSPPAAAPAGDDGSIESALEESPPSSNGGAADGAATED
jgi:ribosomal subunit interface protein